MRPAALDLERVWAADGWRSGDQHFHLNYGRPLRASTCPTCSPVLAGEGLNHGTPLVANLHTRYSDDERWGETASADGRPGRVRPGGPVALFSATSG